ncbi:DUF72 domain-containing protein [Thermodesulfatator atlanticus]
MKKIYVGTCGQVISLKKFFDHYSALEINATFYRFPSQKQIRNWKTHLKAGKEKGAYLSLKAHQIFTHPLRSPTWKRSEFKLEDLKKEKDKIGCLKLNELTLTFLERTKELCTELGIDFVLFQLPSFCREEKEHFANFLAKARDVLPTRIGLEIRWQDQRLLEDLWQNIQIVPVFDPFLANDLRKSFFPKLSFLYLRLHGKKDKTGKINYKHRYSDEELLKLKDWVFAAKAQKICLLFNNVYMRDDTLRFRKIIED